MEISGGSLEESVWAWTCGAALGPLPAIRETLINPALTRRSLLLYACPEFRLVFSKSEKTNWASSQDCIKPVPRVPPLSGTTTLSSELRMTDSISHLHGLATQGWKRDRLHELVPTYRFFHSAIKWLVRTVSAFGFARTELLLWFSFQELYSS